MGFKLYIPDTASYRRLSEALSPSHIRTCFQKNVFFDGAAGELSSTGAVLRFRFDEDGDGDDWYYGCVFSLTSHARLDNGITMEDGDEHISPIHGSASIAEPKYLASLVGSSRIMQRVKEEFFGGGGEGDLMDFVCLGMFSNVRELYRWKNEIVELIETNFEFGTTYEVLCQWSNPCRAKELIEEFLREKSIPYSHPPYPETSKFAMFRAGKLMP